MACKDCFSGTIHDGTPAGREQTIHGLPTYVSEAPTPPIKGFIVIIPDAIGWDFNNNRILADNYAKKANCTVLMPDFMDGAACHESVLNSLDYVMNKSNWMITKVPKAFHIAYHIIPFMMSNREAVAKSRIYNWFRLFRAANPATPIGVAGFCWGGKYTAHLCAGWNNPILDPTPASNTFTPDTKASESKTDEMLVDCGFTAHPSYMVVPRDIEHLKKPLSIGNGTEDVQLTPEKLQVVKELFAKKEGQEPETELVIYDKAKHGFAVRWNPKDEREQRQGEESEDQAVKWFLKHFGKR